MQPLTDEEVAQTLCDPIYAGIGAYPRRVSDEDWIAGARRVIATRGLDFFLSTLLTALRASFGYSEPAWRRALLDQYADDEGEAWEWFAELLPGQEMPQVFVRMLCDPAYTGVGQRPRIMSDEQWMRNVRRIVAERQLEFFLPSLLDSLRRSLGVCSP